MRFPLFVLAAAMMVSTPAFADKAKCQAEVKACNDKCGAGDQDCFIECARKVKKCLKKCKKPKT
ncbi:MAG: hypothetical protein ACR2PI_14590 [Hyphomicrobiaceae bacterium]